MKNLIVTADDFGVFPSINLAIKESVLAGKVNSVAAISNYADSVKNVKEFIGTVGDKADIGCHLTISSGKPLTIINNEVFTKGKYFWPFSRLRIDAIEKQGKILEKELKAQVEVLLDSGIKVTHLSCHHSILTATKGLFKVYLEVTEHFKLPMRSVNIVPKQTDMAYRNYLQFLLLNRVPVSKLVEIKRFGKEINEFLKSSKPNIKTPAILESGHYGPWLNIWDIGLKGRVKRKHNHLSSFLRDFITKDYKYAELMLHLSKAESELKKQDSEIDYPGISRSYFKNRNAEFYSINTFNFGPYFEKIKLDGWKNL
jgi:predicted glycoside hydrolase/deacetylase ChbG (UPF0249 family)